MEKASIRKVDRAFQVKVVGSNQADPTIRRTDPSPRSFRDAVGADWLFCGLDFVPGFFREEVDYQRLS